MQIEAGVFNFDRVDTSVATLARKFGHQQTTKGLVNIGAHVVLLRLDVDGNLVVEVAPRGNECEPIQSLCVTQEQSLLRGGTCAD